MRSYMCLYTEAARPEEFPCSDDDVGPTRFLAPRNPHTVRRIREAVSRLSEERAYRDVFKSHQTTEMLPQFNIRLGQVQCHSVLCVLFSRLKKYANRGIDIIDAPAGSTKFDISNVAFAGDMLTTAVDGVLRAGSHPSLTVGPYGSCMMVEL